MRDVAAELDAAARRDDLLLSATEGFRAPLANLHAAAETLAGNPDIAPADRKRFETVLLEESSMLCDRLETLAEGYRDLGGVKWFMAEIHSRSEEHTSELQSLMRISYAVFCLKKKNSTTHTYTIA